MQHGFDEDGGAWGEEPEPSVIACGSRHGTNAFEHVRTLVTSLAQCKLTGLTDDILTANPVLTTAPTCRGQILTAPGSRALFQCPKCRIARTNLLMDLKQNAAFVGGHTVPGEEHLNAWLRVIDASSDKPLLQWVESGQLASEDMEAQDWQKLWTKVSEGDMWRRLDGTAGVCAVISVDWNWRYKPCSLLYKKFLRALMTRMLRSIDAPTGQNRHFPGKARSRLVPTPITATGSGLSGGVASRLCDYTRGRLAFVISSGFLFRDGPSNFCPERMYEELIMNLHPKPNDLEILDDVGAANQMAPLGDELVCLQGSDFDFSVPDRGKDLMSRMLEYDDAYTRARRGLGYRQLFLQTSMRHQTAHYCVVE